MSTNVSLIKMGVGQGPGVAELDCVAPNQPYFVLMRDTSTGEVYSVAACANPNVDPCDGGGILNVLDAAGYVFVDDPCP